MTRARDNANLGVQAGSGLDASDITTGVLPVGVTGGSGLTGPLQKTGGAMTGNIVMGDDTSIGIGDAAERIEFDGAGDISVMGANLGIGTDTPTKNLQVGTDISTATSSPVAISLGGTHSSSAGVNPKLHLWTDGTSSMALGVSSNQIDYIGTSAAFDHVFYGNGVELQRIRGTGEISQPKQPAFKAYKNNDTTIAASTWTTLIFPGERFDHGGDYNQSTGVFTAPITGKYQMNFTVRIDTISHSSPHASVQLNSSNVNHMYQALISPTAYDSVLSYTTFHCACLIDMDAGDTVMCSAMINGSTGVHVNYTGNTFSGYLVA
jgi:hypothetical protein